MNMSGKFRSLGGLTVSVPENVLFQKLGDSDDEIVLLDMDSGGYYGLNEVGSRIWVLLQEGYTPSEALNALVQEYEVSEEQLRNDMEQFLIALHTRGLIQSHEKDTN